eukprot:GFUD01016811.1.p1 GENE.GFUD01016811.1~~GFUD01016811.1.p1  ORF type:complete len:340 (+),score=91.60 GFUD01016811.1:120-1139(+)
MECSASLSVDLLTLLKDPDLSDLIIQTQDGQISVHSVILSARSPVFRNMLRKRKRKEKKEEKETDIITIKDFEVNVIKAMVRYIYTDKIDEKFDDMRDLARIGNKYEIQSLVDICCKSLISTISSSNVVELGVFAETYSCKAVLEKCSDIIANDLNLLGEDWEDKVESSPALLLHILKCLKCQKERVVEVERFCKTQVSPLQWSCNGSNKDAIKFIVNIASQLTGIGLFGTETEGENITVDIEVKKDGFDVFSKTTSFTSGGNDVPVKIPVNDVPILPDVEYTVAVLIKATGITFNGEDGIDEVESSDQKLKVCFMKSEDSENGTDVYRGQIPSLFFKM